MCKAGWSLAPTAAGEARTPCAVHFSGSAPLLDGLGWARVMIDAPSADHDKLGLGRGRRQNLFDNTLGRRRRRRCGRDDELLQQHTYSRQKSGYGVKAGGRLHVLPVPADVKQWLCDQVLTST